jgi:hypothetical protein
LFSPVLLLFQTVAMKFILKHGKTDKDIHNLRQEIEVNHFYFYMYFGFGYFVVIKQRIGSGYKNYNSDVVSATIRLCLSN